MEEVTVDREAFEAYLEVRDSGETNMFAVSTVVELAEGALTKEQCYYIMQHFEELMEKYGEQDA